MTLFHVAIGYAHNELPVTTIQNSFGKSAGWARYAPNCWLLYTDEPAEAISNRIRKLCSASDSILVIKVDTNHYNGFLHKEIWDWFNERK